MLLFLFSCFSDHYLTSKIVEERLIYDTAYVVIHVEVEKEVEVEVIVPEEFPVWSQTYIQPTHGNGVDILWVVDPSGSMHGNWSQVVIGVEQMMMALPTNVNWRLEIIPTDPNRAYALNSFPILPGDSLATVQSHLQNNVTGHYEQGMDAVKKYIQYNIDFQQWTRQDAALLIVFVSDENDHSSITTSEFISWISLVRSEVFVTSVVNVDYAISACPNEFSLMDIGLNYMNVANYFGGTTIDICSIDWSSGVAQAAQQIQMVEEVILDFTPVDIDHIEVFVDNVLWPDWVWDEPTNTILFTITPPEGSIITVSYNYL